MNGSLAAYWKTIVTALENAREDCSEREFAALQLGVFRELGLVERSKRGRPKTIVPVEAMAEAIRLLELGRSEREIALRLHISRRQVRAIREEM
jgi:hypothetical protein